MSVFKTVKGFIPVYPIVFNILYVLSIYQVNANVVPFKCTAVPFFNGMISTAFCIVIAAIVLRSIYAATWLSALLSIAAFIFPFVGVNLSESWSIVLFPVIIFSIVATTIVLRLKQLAWLINITRFMNLLAFCSLGCSLVLTVFCYYDDDRQVAGPDANFTEMFQSELPLESKNVKDPLESPDIVFVVVDGYARQDVLEDMYNYENSEFMHFLHKKHFFVADKSCANYCQTVLSMASAFNGSYFEADSNHISRLSRSLADQSFNHSRVSQFLKENGYKIALTYSGYNNVCTIQGVSAEAPSWVRDFNSINFENAVKSRLTLGVPHQYRDLIGRLYMTPSLCYYALTHAEWSHSRRIIDSVREMTEYPLINTPRPTFLFSHIVSPHPPFVFSTSVPSSDQTDSYNDADHWIYSTGYNSGMYRKAYKEHLQKFNELLKDAIDQRISNKGSRDLVLVVISDHGPGSEFKLNDIATGNYRERLSNLCAIYSSNNDVTGFYPEMTPINLMRILLNKYFLKEPLPLVKDHSFVSTWNDPFCFKEYIPEKE